MKSYTNIDLSKYHTFHVASRATALVEIESLQQFLTLITNNKLTHPIVILGGGSNVLFKEDWPGTVLINKIQGIDLVGETDDFVSILVHSGTLWDELTAYCASHGYWGIENMSGIPGTCGAAPIQNIGAYGQEVEQVIESVNFFDFKTAECRELKKADCCFGYRDSIFKNELRNRTFIHSIQIKLSKIPTPNVSYPSLAEKLQSVATPELTPVALREAILSIRTNKLPDPDILGNAGSFFKNPIIPLDDYKKLQREFPDIPGFTEMNMVKISAAWLIEKSGWKGVRMGNTGTFHKQPLVLVNYGNATAGEILDLARKIIETVEKKFQIKIEPEVQIY
ncbi:MAG: UDP-N-acetylmuramate dehydrogenase [Ignavibacteria bacterium]|nr:UDP-N-acetylmuramate dehydrogenase [Ignavibacteria bacterium]